MPEKQKPTSEIVKKAAHFLKHPEDATLTDIKSMAARLMDDQRNDPVAHRATAIKPKMKIAAPRADKSVGARKGTRESGKKSKAA